MRTLFRSWVLILAATVGVAQTAARPQTAKKAAAKSATITASDVQQLRAALAAQQQQMEQQRQQMDQLKVQLQQLLDASQQANSAAQKGQSSADQAQQTAAEAQRLADQASANAVEAKTALAIVNTNRTLPL